MATYTWTGTDWLDVSTGKIGGGPGAGDTLFFRAGITNDVTLLPEDITGGPYANIFVNHGAAVDFGTLSGPDQINFDNFTVDNVFAGVGASVSLIGSIAGLPAAETMHAHNVFLAPGSTLNFGNLPPVGGPDTIDNLYNSGTLINATNGNLQLGGPGFVQVGGFQPHESEFGQGGAILTLGNIAQGSVVAAIDEIIDNAPAGGVFNFKSPGSAFTLTPGNGAATIGVNTAVLGAHTAMVAYTSGSVHDTLMITDRIV